MLPHKQIEHRLQEAIRAVLPDADVASALVRPCPDPKFGDYQCNAIMSLAKSRKLNPRQVATDVVAKLDVGHWCEKVEIAGAGFLNFRLKTDALAESLQSAARGEHLFFEKTAQPRTAVIDFSSPNVAKPMHVGHIRSTILGDSLARTLRQLGHRVITDNHIGDWGTQFGMLIFGYKFLNLASFQHSPIEELVRIYKHVSKLIEDEEKQAEAIEIAKNPGPLGAVIFTDDATPIARACRMELVYLQRGGKEQKEIWNICISESLRVFDTIYSRLRVKFDLTLGESFYNERLESLAKELVACGIARESEGALAVFFDEIPHLKEHPALIRKSDGGFNYTTTDLATLEYRTSGKILENPDLIKRREKTKGPINKIVYVTDGRQQLHFQQVFAAFCKWQSAIGNRQSAIPKLAHVWFGSILGEDGKPFKTRSGETVKLADLLDEAEERAFKIVSEKNPDVPESQRREIARVTGIGAVKYADLLPNRQSDYVFSWDKMLALNGNTAPYLQYAYARIRSIFRKAEETSNSDKSRAGIQHPTSNIQLAANEELALAKHLLNFGLTLEAVAEEYRPNFLCNYLYDLAGRFTSFYENCPVLRSEGATRATRLLLCDLTARVLKQGLECLGIEVVEQM